MRRISMFFSILSATLILLTMGQACSVATRFNSLDLSSSLKSELSGNGGGYEGKLRVLHHYENGFTCGEGKPQPESILIRKNATDWVVIRNTKKTCAAVDQSPVSQVDYDDVTKVAYFEGRQYIPPKPYIVDPNEDPNLPDVKLIDGVCEDINGKCSLRASIENAGLATWTADTLVQITSATYKINKPIHLVTSHNSHTILFQGQGAQTTIFDGQGITDLLKIDPMSGTVAIDGVTFQNAVVTSETTAAPGVALSMDGFNTKLIVSNSLFKNNKGSNTLYSIGANNIEIRRSQFINNVSDRGTLYFFTANSVLVDQSTIDGGRIAGIYILGGGITQATISNSFVGNGANFGVLLDTCSGCKILNSTIANNGGTGLKIYSFQPKANLDVLLNNVTLANNGSTGDDSNMDVDFQNNPTYKVILNNSILVNKPTGMPNCYFSPATNSTHTIVATNSLFDDTTCSVTGSGNVYVVDPQLSAVGPHGGPTPTLLPSLTSPVLNAGDPLTCSAQDQRGVVRPANCDIGAVEIP